MTLTPREWDILTGQVARSDDLAEALTRQVWDEQDAQIKKDLQASMKDAMTHPKTSQTVPVVRYEGDRRIVVGTAEVEMVDGDVHATFVINSGSISKRFGTIGPFSIGEPKPPAPVHLDGALMSKFEKANENYMLADDMNGAMDTLMEFIREHNLTPEQEQLDKSWKNHED